MPYQQWTQDQRISLSTMDGGFLRYALVHATEIPPRVVTWEGRLFCYIDHNDGTTWQYEEVHAVQARPEHF